MKGEDRALLRTLQAIENRPKQKPKDNVPSLYYEVPELTSEILVNSVQTGVAPWRLLSDIARESIEEQKARKLREKYEMVRIPQPEW